MRRIVAGIFVALAFAASAAAQDSGDAGRDRFEAILDTALNRYPMKAVLAGVATDGGAPWLAARGESMTGVPATQDMHFRNGSVAIAYLGTLLLQLAEQGTVALDDPLSKWFPEYPKADAVTLDMLIHGTSGYGDHVTDDGFLQAYYDNPFRHWEPEELIAIGLSRPMVCDPGTCWSYSHSNFVILGEVLAKASGKPVAVLMRENILGPIGLEGTRSDQTAVIPEPVLHAFDAERGRYEESTFWDPSWILAKGAVMTSTIADLLTSARAIGQGTLVSPKSHALQLAPTTATFPPWNETTWYGAGVFVINGWIVQNPSFAGYAATMAYLPARKLAIAVSVTVTEDANPAVNYSSEILTEIAAALAPEAPFPSSRSP